VSIETMGNIIAPGQKGSSHGSSDSGFGNAFWEKKTVKLFHIFDTNKDGVLEESDCELAAENLIKITKLDEVQAKRIRNKFLTAWRKLLGGQVKVTPEAFVKGLKDAGRERLMSEIAIVCSAMFDAMDYSGDGTIEVKELGAFLQAFQIEVDAAETFKLLDKDSDGKITADEYLQASVEYFTHGHEHCHSKHLFGVWSD